jgi:2-oxoglutarate dehydrogenase E1 component
MFEEFGINAGFVEDLHARYMQSPQSVDEDWRTFFAALGADPAPTPRAPAAPSNGKHGNGNGAARAAQASEDRVMDMAAAQGRVFQLVNAYRVRGHLFAKVDPLGKTFAAAPELDLANFGLTHQDLDTPFPSVGISGLPERATLREIIAHLEETYCSSIGVEFTHIEEPEMRDWLQARMESGRNRCDLSNAEVLRVLTRLTDAEIFEQFIDTNFRNAKRFSCEGAESMIAMLDLLVDAAGAHAVEEIVIGMAHRGRLNVLVNIMDKPIREIFAAFSDRNPERFIGGGDVKYHLGHSTDRKTESGATVHLSLCFNPSHLEFVNPVVEGRVRAKQDRKKRNGVMPLLIHGDAAFMGQGIIPETLNLAGLEGYTTGGTIHLVVNNQIGFTTIPEDSRSTRYCTDITRMMKVPVFHVNGEDPEAVVQVARLAIEFRTLFGKDVVIDMYGYRKYGHNEGDEPRFTQPRMYALVDKKPTVRQVYVGKLITAGKVTQERADALVATRKAALEQALEEERKGDYQKMPNAMEGVWTSYFGGPDAMVPEVPTAVPESVLKELIERITHVPETFNVNPKIRDTVLAARRKNVLENKPFDWGTAEHLAFASLLAEGRSVRLSGQDSRRGTFAHRHSVLFDTVTGERYSPLQNLGGTGKFDVFDSPLSEAGVLGFEYGYSLDAPDSLVLWEAQFGDFLNGAQVIVDQFIVSAEDKWLRLSGLVLLLPHGYEGQGPEHSSARIERFMQMAAQDNIQVCNLTTPAQIFHALRRQVLRPWRKPLVIFTPKSVLRAKDATSTLSELSTGSFRRVIADDTVEPAKVKRVLLCSGKVYYDLAAARKAKGRDDVAIVRLEQLYPLNDAITAALAPFADGTPLIWVQEEPRNMGAWTFMLDNLKNQIGDRLPLSVVSRPADASPATGSKASHDLEQRRLIEQAFAV